MIKQEIVEKISRYFKLTQFEAEKIYEDIFSIIIQGVKDDNIVDLANFGEFIIKYNNGKEGTSTLEYKKTVEFLATSKFEEDLNDKFNESEAPVSDHTSTTIIEQKPVETFIPVPETKKEEVIKETREDLIKEPEKITNSDDSMGDDIRRKREEILSKLTKAEDEATKEKAKKTEEYKTFQPIVFPKIKPIESYMDPKPETSIENVQDNKIESERETVKTEEIKETEIKSSKNLQEADDLSQKTFSDYFTEVKNEPVKEKEEIHTINKEVHEKTEPVKVTEKITEEHKETVIPQSAVELHNQITNKETVKTYQTVETHTPVVTTGNGNGNGNGHSNGNGNGNTNEYVLDDNSYYIWYKDTESSPNETQTMSYEYELLYQATKEAEYQSKLKIYVTTFIVFFSIVLILLIFSPLIYKVFFKTPEVQKTENVQGESNNGTQDNSNQNSTQNGNTVTSQQSQSDNTQNTQSQQNNQTQQPTQNTDKQTQQNTQPVQTQENTQTKPEQQNTQQQTTQQNTQTEQPKQNNDQKPEGVVKNGLGYMDDKLKVIYVQLENGKYTIQESAWDSDSKANKRISTIETFGITGLKGSVLKVDLDKGTWYRARFGEFSSLQEAKSKAEEMRNKERIRLQAFLLTFLMYT